MLSAGRAAERKRDSNKFGAPRCGGTAGAVTEHKAHKRGRPLQGQGPRAMGGAWVWARAGAEARRHAICALCAQCPARPCQCYIIMTLYASFIGNAAGAPARRPAPETHAEGRHAARQQRRRGHHRRTAQQVRQEPWQQQAEHGQGAPQPRRRNGRSVGVRAAAHGLPAAATAHGPRQLGDGRQHLLPAGAAAGVYYILQHCVASWSAPFGPKGTAGNE